MLMGYACEAHRTLFQLGLALANNNALFLILFLIFAFLGPIRSLAPTWNYAVSMLGASGVVLAASFG